MAGLMDLLGLAVAPSVHDIVNARARRAGGSKNPEDVLLDRYGTGLEMGPVGVPVSMAYEAAKPIMASVPLVNRAVGAIFGPDQMVGAGTQQASPSEALANIAAVSRGALQNVGLSLADLLNVGR
jgi:hypothetical protein